MRRATIDAIELEYEDRGSGEPVVLMHAGLCAGWFEPLLDEPALAGDRLIRYHRAGYAGSSHPWGEVTIEDHARHCRGLLDHLGIERAHVVGHSSSADVALQLALDAPERVASLTLMEPALMPVPSRATWGKSVAVPAVEAYRSGDRARAVDLWMRGVAGDGWREPMDRALPAAFEQAVADAPTFFEQELPAVQSWSFGERDASRIRQPALAVIGARSPEVSPVWEERQALLLAWLPNVVPFVLEHATHLLHVQNPSGMAEALAAHVARHAAAAV
jgi:pimeloyl-ACP methyl ester carboxylesterase